MDDVAFWKLVDQARQTAAGNLPLQAELLSEALARLPDDQIYGYEARFRAHLKRANHYNVMAAAKLLEGYVSDDVFIYFRAFLIAAGQQTLDAAINDTDSLAQLELADGEDMLYVADKAFLRKHGGKADKPLPRDHAPAELNYDLCFDAPEGDDWEDSELPARFPRLWRRYQQPSNP